MNWFWTAGSILGIIAVFLGVYGQRELVKQIITSPYVWVKKRQTMLNEWRIWCKHRPKMKITKMPLDISTENISGTKRIKYITSVVSHQ